MTNEQIVDAILDMLRTSPVPLKRNEISKRLEIRSDSEEYANLRNILHDLTDQCVVDKSSRRRYSLMSFTDTSEIKGIMKIRKDYGIVETDIPEFKKISIKKSYLNTALDGDTVIVQLHATKKKKNKLQGEVESIVSRNTEKFAGTIEFDGFFYFMVPDEKKFYIDFLVPDTKLGGAMPGDKVTAKLLHWDDHSKSPHAEIIDIIGQSGNPSAEFDAIISDFNLPEEFPAKVLDEAKEYEAPQLEAKYPERLDLREENIITIDPADAKDFDDALSLKTLDNGNLLLGVHIADVSHYVWENSELDIEARMRGNSIYLVDRVIPMLPEELSNEICSLKPNEPRFAYSVMMELTEDGTVVDYLIKETIIDSKQRLSYEQALDMITTQEGENSELICALDKVAKKLKKRRYQTGGIQFDTRELKFKLDEAKRPVEIIVKRSNDATSLVEECMLLTNQVVAGHVDLLTKKFAVKELPFLYRVHDSPDPKKTEVALDFIKMFGVKTKKKVMTSKEINQLLESLKEVPEKDIIHMVLIRSMAKAEYSTDNIGHYGLGFTEYSHFTSPIRRYADLLIHRLLKEYEKGRVMPDRLKFLKYFAKDVGKNTTDKEKQAMEAERASIKLANTIMVSNFVGDTFNGTVSGVSSFGIFVMIDKYFAEGLIHIRDLNDDYYIYDEKKMRLVGRRRKKTFYFGKKLRVKLVKVNIEKRSIDFDYVDDNYREED